MAHLDCADGAKQHDGPNVEFTQSLNAVPAAAGDEADQALLRASRAVMVPLARLAVARGTRYAQID